MWLKGNHTIICHVEAITLSAERQAINSEDVFRRRGDTPPRLPDMDAAWTVGLLRRRRTEQCVRRAAQQGQGGKHTGTVSFERSTPATAVKT